MLNILIAFLAAYLIGALPTGFLLSKLKGKDVFQVGSGNMGTMNVLRNIDRTLGVAVLIIDMLKGAAAVLLASWLGSGDLQIIYAANIGVVTGHLWSVYIGFRGGKALATALGTAIALHPWVALACFLTLVLLTLVIKGKSNLAAVVSVALFPIITAAVSYTTGLTGSAFILKVATVAIFSVLIIIKHLDDVQNELASRNN